MRISYIGYAPKQGHPDDAGYDLRAAYHGLIEPRGTTMVPCNLQVDIPVGFVGLVCSRSGLSANHGVFVLNAPGVIDPGYHGEVMAILANFSDSEFKIAPGDRIAQLLVCPTAGVEFVLNFNAFDRATTSRGSDGFGSTGKD